MVATVFLRGRIYVLRSSQVSAVFVPDDDIPGTFPSEVSIPGGPTTVFTPDDVIPGALSPDDSIPEGAVCHLAKLFPWTIVHVIWFMLVWTNFLFCTFQNRATLIAEYFRNSLPTTDGMATPGGAISQGKGEALLGAVGEIREVSIKSSPPTSNE